MKITPKAHADTYDKQKELSSFSLPPKGTYDVVNVAAQRQLIGQGTPKIRIRAHVLAAVESGDGNPGAAFVGRTFPLDLWANWEKAANVQRISWLGIACGQTEDWDPDNDADLVKAVTGTPYRITFDIKRGTYQGKPTEDLQVLECKQLGAAAREKYTKAPDWKATVGDPGERMLEEKDFTKSGGSGGGSRGGSKHSERTADNPFGNDDIPF